MQQEVTQALIRSSTVFINYLSEFFRDHLGRKLIFQLLRGSSALLPRRTSDNHSAHEVALARGAKSVTGNDIMNAIDVIEFGPPQELKPILEKELAGK